MKEYTEPTIELISKDEYLIEDFVKIIKEEVESLVPYTKPNIPYKEEISTFEKCNTIRRRLLNRAAEVMVYNWGDEFSTKYLKELPEDIYSLKNGIEYFNLKLDDLTKQEMIELGFCTVQEKPDLMLIPLWLFPFLDKNIETESIDGVKFSKKSDLDLDNRFGCLPHGIISKNRK